MDTLPLGAHLETPRRGYVHHGIYVGDGRVVHYAGSNRMLRRGPVEEVPLVQFTRGRVLRVKAHPAPRYAATAAVERARSRLGEDRYSVLSFGHEPQPAGRGAGTVGLLAVRQGSRTFRGRRQPRLRRVMSGSCSPSTAI